MTHRDPAVGRLRKQLRSGEARRDKSGKVIFKENERIDRERTKRIREKGREKPIILKKKRNFFQRNILDPIKRGAPKSIGQAIGDVALVGTGGLSGFGAKLGFAAAKGATTGGRAVVSATVSAHRLIKTKQGAEKLIGIGVRRATRNFVGRPPPIGKFATKLFKSLGPKTAPTALRFAGNSKSLGLTTRFLSFARSPAGVVSIIGSYPFAGFIKEEALQTIGFATKSALDAGDLHGADIAIRETEEILDPDTWTKILSKIPYANVVNQLINFYGSARVKLNQDKRILLKARGGIEFEGTSIGEDIRARDVEQQKQREERDIEFKESERKREERDVEFRESEKERNERQEERDREFLLNQQERDIADRQDAAYFEVLRQMKSPFPDGTPIENIDPEIVKLARESNLFLGQF